MNDETNDSDAVEEVDWENRVLCSDESCIGVIGPDGRCKECGRSHEGQSATSTMPTEESEPTAAPDEAEPVDQPAPENEASSSDDDDWENRTLCSDESCIGVIGPDGRCKECGKPYAG